MPNDPIPTPSPTELNDDPLAERPTAIFRRRDLLRVGHVPDADRIVGRDPEIKAVEDLLRPGVHGDPPGNAIIYGKTGSGKSLVARHVTGRATALATANDINLAAVYIDCDQHNTTTRAARELAQTVNQQTGHSMEIPDKGLGASEYFTDLYALLENHDVLIVVLDEIDKLGNDEILFKLSRAEESGKTDCYIGMIAISNKIEYYEQLDERVKSSLQDEELVFDPYDAEQLQDILRNRRDAFCDGVLAEGVIPRVAALSAREHGDARKAIEILSSAGTIAARNDDDTVTEAHVDAAQEYAEASRFQELIRGSTPHSKYVLLALAHLEKTSRKEAFATGRVYEVYLDVCDAVGADALSHQRVLELLKEWSFSDVTENRHTGGGKSQGSYREHSLLHDSDMVLGTVFEGVDREDEILNTLRE